MALDCAADAVNHDVHGIARGTIGRQRLNLLQLALGLNFYADLRAFLQQHRQNIFRRMQAKQLAVLPLFKGDFIALNQPNKIPRAIALQRRLTKVRIVGNVVIGFDKVIGEVTSATTGHEDFFADLIGLLQHQHPPPLLGRSQRTHQPRRAGAEDNNIWIMR